MHSEVLAERQSLFRYRLGCTLTKYKPSAPKEDKFARLNGLAVARPKASNVLSTQPQSTKTFWSWTENSRIFHC